MSKKDGKKRSRVPTSSPEAKRAAQVKKLQALRATQGAAQSGMPPPSAFAPTAQDGVGVSSAMFINKAVDSPPAPVVNLANGNHAATQEHTMTLTLKGISRNGKRAIYTGAAISITIGLGAFPYRNAPASYEVADGVFAPARAAKVPREKQTPEQKEAARLARKNAPKPTLAEKIARREAALAKDKAKLAAGTSDM